MGVPYQPPAAAVAAGQVLCRVYHYLGFDSKLLRWGEELRWCHCDPSVPWCIRGCGDAGFCSDHFTGKSPVCQLNLPLLIVNIVVHQKRTRLSRQHLVQLQRRRPDPRRRGRIRYCHRHAETRLIDRTVEDRLFIHRCADHLAGPGLLLDCAR